MNKEMKEIFNQIVGKKYKTVFIIIWAALSVYSEGLILSATGFSIGIEWILGVVGWMFIMMIMYYLCTSQARKSVKTLARTNKLDYAKEIISKDYNSNGRIGFSEHLLYDKQTKAVVAYDDIVWVYKHVAGRYNVEILFCTVDGRKHKSKIDDLTLKEFLKRRSGILVGYTPQNRAAYEMKVKAFNLQEINKARISE